MIRISGILLGAGESKRMGVNKLLLPWGKKTVFEHCLHTLLCSNIKEIVVVLSDRTRGIGSQLKKRSTHKGKKVKVIINRSSRQGMSTSIRRGIQVMDPTSQGILIALGDQPFLKTRTVNTLIEAFDKGKGGIIVPVFQGKRGHPVIFHCRYKKELLKLGGDRGGKSILLRYPQHTKTIRVKSEGVIKDIDTWQDYKRRVKRWKRV